MNEGTLGAESTAKIEERAVAAKQLAAASAAARQQAAIARLHPEVEASGPSEADLDDPDYLEAIAESEQEKRESERKAWHAVQREPAVSVWGEVERVGRDARGSGCG